MRKGLKIFRLTNDLTQREMAAKLNVSLSTYNLIEQGKRRGSQEFWLKLQQEFNLDGGKVWELQSTTI